MPKNMITSERRATMPSRGRTKFHMLLQALKQESLLGLSSTATKEEAEMALFAHIAKRAVNVDDPVSGQLLTNLLARVFPVNKPTLPTVDIGIDPDDTPEVMSRKILLATCSGQIPTDIGDLLMSMIKNKLVIDERSDLISRLTLLEEQLSASPSTNDEYVDMEENDND